MECAAKLRLKSELIIPRPVFFVGAKLQTDPKEKGPLIIREAKVHSGTLLLAFEGVADRTAVENCAMSC